MRSLIERIGREGPVPFSVYMEVALYGDEGFYTSGRGAGRAGRDFVTSPEVGSLFGALVARAIDRSWHELGEPDPFVVIEPGAGRGRLAADVLRAAPDCAPALRYILVERSDELRAHHGEHVRTEPFEDALGPVVPDSDEERPQPVPGLGPLATSLSALPTGPFTGIVIANELLDNLPFDLVARSGEAWRELRVGCEGDAFEELAVPASHELSAAADAVAAANDVPDGTTLPVPAIRAWFGEVATSLERGRLIVIDYAVPAADLIARGRGWLRTYRGHERGGTPLEHTGSQDITCDLPLEYLVRSGRRVGFDLVEQTDQASWLRSLGIDSLVAQARADWRAGASVGDLAALAARSRVDEAAALLDETGLGTHTVLMFER